MAVNRVNRETFAATLLAESRRLAELSADVANGRPAAEVVAVLELTGRVMTALATYARELA